MKILNIAFVTKIFPETSETFIVNQITSLIDKGHSVHIFAFKKNEEAILHKSIIDYKLLEKTTYLKDLYIVPWKRYKLFIEFIAFNPSIKISKIASYFLKTAGWNLRFFIKYLWILNKGDFEIFHAHFGPMGNYLAEMKEIGYLRKAKLVTSFHGYDLESNMIKFHSSYAVLSRQTDCITINGKFMYSLLPNNFDPEKVKILPVGLDTQKFQKKLESRGELFTVLFVGRLIEFKAPDLAIKILQSLLNLGHNNVQLVIIGKGPMEQQLSSSVEKMGLTEQIKFRGALSQEQIIEEMSKAEIFLLPGIYDKNGRAETQGLVIQEAQAMELPVIVSDVGGMKNGLLNGETGYVVKENKIDEFVLKIELLMQNKELRKEMGKRGRQFVVENYDSKLLGNQLEEIYFKLLQE